jgi:hypothetical protein
VLEEKLQKWFPASRIKGISPSETIGIESEHGRDHGYPFQWLLNSSVTIGFIFCGVLACENHPFIVACVYTI